MRFLAVFCFAAAVATPADMPYRQSGFRAASDGAPAGWHTFAVRPEIAPRTWVDEVHSRGDSGSLAISGNSNAAEYGGWERTVRDIEPEKWYRFSALYRTAGVDYEPWQVLARLTWATADGKGAGRPDYPYKITRDGEWTRLTMEVQAPAKAGAVTLQLYLQNAPRATVWWDDVSLEPMGDPGPRQVTVASLNYRPRRQTGSAIANVKDFVAAAESAIPGKVDVILFPEGSTAVDTRLDYAAVAGPLPGPVTEAYGELARRKHAYVIAGVYEREGQAVYNTAVLIDRNGKLVGKYRKVYIPREEIEVGITPGADYPVFDTDFGRVGMMICWDVEYPEPARALALGGAEIIFLPIWDGDQVLTKARAIENHLFLVASSYGAPNQVLDPNGEQLAVAPKLGSAAVATIDLNRRYKDDWLGDMRARMMKEYRGDVPIRRPDYGR